MLPQRIILCDQKPALIAAWEQVFQAEDRVSVVRGDILDQKADAMLSPANSFGIMDGGLDATIRSALGHQVERDAQSLIVERYHGELPVGVAEVIPTRHEVWKWLVVAPTMRVPERVDRTLNAYLCFRAALLAISRHNMSRSAEPIHSLVAPGLCTGIGGMLPRRSAAQMKVALAAADNPARIPPFDTIHLVHQRMLSAT